MRHLLRPTRGRRCWVTGRDRSTTLPVLSQAPVLSPLARLSFWPSPPSPPLTPPPPPRPDPVTGAVIIEFDQDIRYRAEEAVAFVLSYCKQIAEKEVRTPQTDHGPAGRGCAPGVQKEGSSGRKSRRPAAVVSEKKKGLRPALVLPGRRK
eukprot:scaffold30191_cov96-Isochrysis_galbana.AAC.2